MNFLAHFYLCKGESDLIVGNFLGDFIHGKKYLQYSSNVQKGILMHRLIDSYTDKHQETKRAVKSLYSDYGKYASVIVDVFFDYCLALKWKDYSDKALQQFSQEVYSILSAAHSSFGNKPMRSFKHMKEHNWLNAYASQAGIQKSLYGLSMRAKYENHIASSAKTLFNYTDFYLECFMPLFDDLILYSNEIIELDLESIEGKVFTSTSNRRS